MTRKTLAVLTLSLAVPYLVGPDASAAPWGVHDDFRERPKAKKKHDDHDMEEFEKAMEAWAEKFAADMEKWGQKSEKDWEEWAKQFEARFAGDAEKWEEIAELWEEQHEEKMEAWAEKYEDAWEEWAERYEEKWEAWGDRYADRWEDWAEQLEDIDELSAEDRERVISGFVENLAGLQQMPLNDLPMHLSLPLKELSGLAELNIEQTIEDSLAAALAGLESMPIDQKELGRLIQERTQALTEGTEHLRKRLAVRDGKLDKASARQWARLGELLGRLEDGDLEGNVVIDLDDMEGADALSERLRERIVESLQKHSSNSAGRREFVERLSRERDEVRERDAEIEELRKQVEELRKQVERLRKDGHRL